MSSTCFPESAGFPSDLSAQECRQSHSAKSIRTAEPSSENIGPRSRSSKTSAASMQMDWLGSDPSMSSAEDFPASRSASRASAKESRTTAISGRKCFALCHSRDPLGSLLKTLLASSRWHSTMCSLTWKASATPRGRLLFRLQLSEHHIDETDSGSLLPTPTATTYGTTNNGKRPDGTTFKTAGKPSLQTMAHRGMLQTPNRTELYEAGKLWPTPTAGDAKASGSRNLPGSKAHTGVSLTDFVRFGNSTTPRMWPTPAARDFRFPNLQSYEERGGGKRGEQLPNVIGGPLNPQWVEWLMGYPCEWTALDALAIQSFRKSRKSSAKRS